MKKSNIASEKSEETMPVKRPKILIVDDEKDILEFLSYNLKKDGFDVQTASNGREGINTAKKFKPDLILLDVMMPELDGVEACVEIRNTDSIKNTFIVFLTARSEDYSQIAGLEAGADDYISKPVKPRVLVSKLNSILRRSGTKKEDSPVEEIAGLKIDRERYVVVKDGEELSLPKKEFELLSLLTSNPGKVFTRETILSSVWGEDVVVGDRTIDVHIRKLREKLGDAYIKTIKGVGYKFEY
jgi:two-component system alkaline phosphatase synthesis response regulator PhoP